MKWRETCKKITGPTNLTTVIRIFLKSTCRKVIMSGPKSRPKHPGRKASPWKIPAPAGSGM